MIGDGQNNHVTACNRKHDFALRTSFSRNKNVIACNRPDNFNYVDITH